jgi:uncharacterized membrane protein YphA (DoxX/SURF4 family)
MNRRNIVIRIFLGAFLVLHGLVHLLYFGQSARYFELQPGMVWPDGSWVFSNLLKEGVNRTLVSTLLVVAAVGLVASGIGILAGQSWWRTGVIESAIFSSVIFILFWNGLAQHLDNQGAIGILINAVILAALLVFHWPNFEF